MCIFNVKAKIEYIAWYKKTLMSIIHVWRIKKNYLEHVMILIGFLDETQYKYINIFLIIIIIIFFYSSAAVYHSTVVARALISRLCTECLINVSRRKNVVVLVFSHSVELYYVLYTVHKMYQNFINMYILWWLASDAVWHGRNRLFFTVRSGGSICMIFVIILSFCSEEKNGREN